MTIPIAPRTAAREKALTQPRENATELSVPIGPRVIEILDLAYRARRPVLLEGPTGIGKSQIVTELARGAGLDVVILDLSLLEPPDLVGLPVIEGGRTRYASPSELPTSGRGVLMLEELNRAEIPVMQPALQLLSARRLHAYELPPGWSCIAAINPEDGDYQVHRLDPALRSRFLQLSVCADREAWLTWALRANIHPVVARIARDHVDLLDHAPPRSWAYASDLLHALRADELAKPDLVRVALRGYLPTSWAMLVTEALTSYPATPAIEIDVLVGANGAAELARLVRELESKKRIDAIAMVASKLRRWLGSDALAARAAAGEVSLASLETLLAALPGDLREQCLDSAVASSAAAALLRGAGHDPAQIVASYASSPLRAELSAWRREVKLHRVQLVVTAVTRLLDREAPKDPRVLERAAEQLSALVHDAGPLGADLARWLRARDLLVDRA